ncbi:hypothetical protein K435DRAFT_757245 [Dendrothele bispora CBS 962.96]|uniref:Uncharacterized protein n=1 Tax=Dendrothele bispora (strain CBS 962.96) TaxID=1314807 RepID=A0A4S8LVF6_DENBC|nr:hypothetical protein K435DRAFT_757245 [Dendrothele bispora CBS 962.96]
MARGAQVQPSEPPLPKVSFQKVVEEDDVDTIKRTGVHDGQARSYGYNDFSEFKTPDHYIRHIEPLEIDLARQVEYDMDEQDKEWLDAVNVERKKEQIDRVSYEVFEVVMDRLEKEWFDLTKNIPKNDFALPSEDSTCAICDDSEGENSNAIVFCDGCNLAVHQDCYGIPYIPEGQWLCRKCTVSPEIPVSCILCPNEGGAFKQTSNGDWVHLLCAIWVPETSVANTVVMEPVTGIDKISKQRWKLKCSICEIREGACIQCAKTSCFTAFHTTCARKDRLLLPMKSSQGSENLTLTCYCDRHLPPEHAEARLAALEEDEEEDEEEEHHASKINKSARAYAKTYKPGPPLVPAIIVERIMQYIQKVSLRKKYEFLLLTARYWSLKREARRGAPLLKRLHLEPWTASNGSGRLQSEEEREMKLQQLRRLRQDLADVRGLTELTRKRESRKLKQMETIRDVLDHSLFYHEPILRKALERLAAMDRNNYFREPVKKEDVPDYYDVVKRPMCWMTIDEKLDRHEYWSVHEFKDDVNLVYDNAVLYNKSGSLIHKNATRLKSNSLSILQDLDRLSSHNQDSSRTETRDQARTIEDMKIEHSTPAPGALTSTPIVGDLEPSLKLLDLLSSSQLIQNELPILLDADPITSLFQYQFPKIKPAPPPKPKKIVKGRPPKTDKEREEENARRRAKRQAEKAAEKVPYQVGTRPSRRNSAATATNAEVGDSSFSSSLSAAPSFEGTPGQAQGPPLSSSSASSSPARRRLEPFPSQPQILDSLDNKGSFTHFNSGWILPADQKRTRRPTQVQTATPPVSVDKSTQPPPRKKPRLDPGSSRLSYSTVEEDNQTLHPSDPIQAPTDVEDYPEMMDVDAPVEIPPESSSVPPEEVDEAGVWRTKFLSATGHGNSSSVEVESGNNKLIIMPDGTRILEELDTPATRREKNMRKKAEREKILAAAAEWNENRVETEPEAAGSTVVETDGAQAVAGPSGTENHIGGAQVEANVEQVAARPTKQESELDSIREPAIAIAEEASATAEKKPRNDRKRKRSNESSPTPQGSRASAPSTVAKSTPARKTGLLTRSAAAEPGAIILKSGEKLPGGTLVWAKSSTFPWWPAVVFDADNETVPVNIKEMLQEAIRKSKEKEMYIVQFFDKTSSWQCNPVSKLRYLGEDKELDDDMLSKTSKRQKWKNATIRNECTEAFKDAQNSIEEDDSSQERTVDNDL